MRGAGRNGEQYRVVYVHVVYMLVAERAARGGSKASGVVSNSSHRLGNGPPRKISSLLFIFFSLSYGTCIGTRLIDNKEEN